MPNKLRRYEILLPLQFNDGRDVPAEWLVDAALEIVENFGAVSYETQKVEGQWRHEGEIYRDTLVKLVVDLDDNDLNRAWMRDFKSRWLRRLDQLELWMVSYEIELE